jgi:hypothetical protein
MERKNGTRGFLLDSGGHGAQGAKFSASLVIERLFRRLGVKTNSTLLQTTPRADFALPFAENEV